MQIFLANFTLPDCEDPAFAEVRFVDLDKEAASEVVALYNKVRSLLFGPEDRLLSIS